MARRRFRDDKPGEANLLPVMNVMFLLIPSLLLAMEVASMAAVVVTPPKVHAASETATTSLTDDWKLRVHLASDGIHVTEGGKPLGDGSPTIPRVDGEHDLEALGSLARELKVAHPEVSAVELTAEGDVPLVELIDAMDALRGEDCSLAGVASGEPPSVECLFWSPLISS